MTTLPVTALIEFPIEAKAKADRAALLAALAEIAAHDGALSIKIDPERGNPILSVLSEEHGGRIVDRIATIHRLALSIGAPHVAYRETIARKVTQDYTLKQQVGQFARVRLTVESNETGQGFVFESKVVGGAFPEDYIVGLLCGLKSVLEGGVLAGFPVVDIKVSLVDGAWHEIESSALAFEIASRNAFREALGGGNSVLIEPVMKVTVFAPEDCASRIVRDLETRRARGCTTERDTDGNAIVHALAPLANMFGYVNQLRSFSQGRASHAMIYDHYAVVDSCLPSGDPPFRPAAAMRVV